MFSVGDTFKQVGDNATIITYTITEVTDDVIFFTRHYMPQDVHIPGRKSMEWMEDMISQGLFYDRNI